MTIYDQLVVVVECWPKHKISSKTNEEGKYVRKLGCVFVRKEINDETYAICKSDDD
jgi:hypothetical protein